MRFCIFCLFVFYFGNDFCHSQGISQRTTDVRTFRDGNDVRAIYSNDAYNSNELGLKFTVGVSSNQNQGFQISYDILNSYFSNGIDISTSYLNQGDSHRLVLDYETNNLPPRPFIDGSIKATFTGSNNGQIIESTSTIKVGEGFCYLRYEDFLNYNVKNLELIDVTTGYNTSDYAGGGIIYDHYWQETRISGNFTSKKIWLHQKEEPINGEGPYYVFGNQYRHNYYHGSPSSPIKILPGTIIKAVNDEFFNYDPNSSNGVSNVVVYPNPSYNGIVFLESNNVNETINSIEVYNSLLQPSGLNREFSQITRPLMTFINERNENQISLNLSHLGSGGYMLKIYSNIGISNKTVIVQ